MDERSQANFDRITKLEIAALTEGDMLFLRARQSYLTPQQKEYYAEVIGSAEEDIRSRFTHEEDPEVSTTDLKKKAGKLGIDHKGKSKEEIELAIDTVEGPAGADQPE